MLTPEAFRELIGDKTIYIYAVNLEGIGFLKLFRIMGFKIGGFIDSRKFPHPTKYGCPIIHPDVFFAKYRREAVVVLTAKHRSTRRQALERCKVYGLCRGETLFTTSDLCSFYPTIEIVGKCNLHCISCNMGVPGANKGKGYMSVETYHKVLTKMRQEIPFLNSVYLYFWGEPLLHPRIDEIIRISSSLGVAVEISTNLVEARHLEKTIAANPEVIVVPCSGVGKKFEQTRTGGNWEKFHANLFELRRLIDHYDADTNVRIHYHLYKHNLDEDYDTVRGLAQELGFQFLPILAHVFPEYVLRHVVYGQPLPEPMQRASELLIFPVEEQLAFARQMADLSCFNIKIFPVVRWDTSVVQCCNMEFPVLAPSYLDITLDELLRRRDGNRFCEMCMSHALHRYFDVAVRVEEQNGKRIVVREI